MNRDSDSAADQAAASTREPDALPLETPDFPTDPKAHAVWLKQWEQQRKKQLEEEQAVAPMWDIYDQRARDRALGAKAQRMMQQLRAELEANPNTEAGLPGALWQLVLRLVIAVDNLDESPNEAAASPR